MKKKSLFFIAIFTFILILNLGYAETNTAAAGDKIHFVSGRDGDAIIIETVVNNVHHYGLVDSFNPETTPGKYYI